MPDGLECRVCESKTITMKELNNNDNINLFPDAPKLSEDTYTPMPVVLRELRNILSPKYGHGESEAMIRLIFQHLKGWSATDMIINENKPLSSYIVEQIREIVGRLLKDEPIQYIVGEAYFYGLDFLVNPGVLIPRPETEELVEMVVNGNKRSDLNVLDACTGSGCIAVALARNLPFPVITAVDNSDKALEIAKENAAKMKVKIKLEKADIFEYEPEEESLDIIVSNPPYVDESEKKNMEANVLEYEPHEALFVPDDNPLLYYRRIVNIGKKALKPGGRIYFEMNPRHADAMRVLLETQGFTAIHSHLDIHGKRRFITAIKPED